MQIDFSSVLDDRRGTAQDQQEELSLELALQLFAANCFGGDAGLECKTKPGGFQVTTASGLIFAWSRWEADPGYTLRIAHPSGKFPPNSALRSSLTENGWNISVYSNVGDHIGYLQQDDSIINDDGKLVIAKEED